MKTVTDSPEIREKYARIYRASSSATVYQSPEWLQVLESLKGDLLFVEAGEDTLIPFICKGMGRLRRCHSLSYDTYGGPVSSAEANVSFDEIVETLKIPSIRMVDFSRSLKGDSNCSIEVHAHVVDLIPGLEQVVSRYTKKNREALRQAKRRGVRIERMEDPNLLSEFYSLHVRTAHRYRTVPHPKRLLQEILKVMVPNNMATFYFARFENKRIACNLVLRDDHSSYDWLLGYQKDSLPLRPANALIDRAIQDEIANGGHSFNLGSSPSTHQGIIKFKESFGAEPFSYRIFSKAGLSYNVMRRLENSVLRLGRKDPIANTTNGS
jgi:lipid II:glycine glycyltransferase (peptidoglycan interpeptide bridge formation enzyme)